MIDDDGARGEQSLLLLLLVDGQRRGMLPTHHVEAAAAAKWRELIEEGRVIAPPVPFFISPAARFVIGVGGHGDDDLCAGCAGCVGPAGHLRRVKEAVRDYVE